MEQRLSLVTLGVRDLARSRAFYESLGWHASSASCDQVCFFQTGSMAMALYPLERLLEESGQSGTAPQPGGVTLGINVITQAEVDRELALVLEKGGTLLHPATDTPWGGRTAYFADPDGHPWEITWAPMFPLGAQGELYLP
ncbi:MAG: VOC family protein [Magnetococcales bacterium]|nr:VOC family protein [Magnetococcales bacterium]MBF0114477.1 VOC family protein [Magnetococcales bacterium]